MSNHKPNQKNIFLSSNYRYHSFSKNNSSTNMSLETSGDDAQKWLERFKPNMQSINKHDIKTMLPRFVQDFIYAVWRSENEEVYEKPKSPKPRCNGTRWNQIKEEIFEGEEQRRQENTFKMSRNNDRNSQDRPTSRFRAYSYKPKPKKKKIFDLAKETANDGFPTLN